MDTVQPVVVHLVHGTRPFGPFRSHSKSDDAWFEKNSPIRKSIFHAAGCPVDAREFRWSGRNSMRARSKAAGELRKHLEDALREQADTVHVIVAHSHGGTVAAQALAEAPIPRDATPRVKGLICLATPFAYMSKTSRGLAQLYTAAWASFLGFIALWTYLIVTGRSWVTDASPASVPIPIDGRLLMLSAVVGLPALQWLIQTLLAAWPPTRPVFSGGTIHPQIPVFLMRTAGDEAALVLGFCQTVKGAANAVFRSWAHPHARLTSILAWLVIFLTCFTLCMVAAAVGLALSRGEIPGVDLVGEQSESGLSGKLQLITVTLVSLAGVLAAIYLSGHAMLAYAVGLADPRYLHGWSIEIDAAFPDRECRFKAYRGIEDDDTVSLRHGIYERADVQHELGRLIRMVAEGKRLQFSEQASGNGDPAAVLNPTDTEVFVSKQHAGSGSHPNCSGSSLWSA